MNQQAAIGLRPHEGVADPAFLDAPPLVALPAEGPSPAAATVPVSLEPCPPFSLEANESLVRRALAVADVTAIAAALLLVLGRSGAGPSALVALASMPLVVLLFKIAGLYNRDELRLGHSTLDEAPLLLQLTAFIALALAILHPFAPHSLSGGEVAALWFVGFALVLAGRVLARGLTRRVVPVERCLVIAEPEQADRVRVRLASSRARTRVVHSLAASDLRSLGGPNIMDRLVHDFGVHRLIIGSIETGTDAVVELIRVAKAVGVRISVLPRILEVVGSAVAFDEIEGMAMLGLPHFGLSRSSRLLKRAFDLAFTAVGLLIISPLLAAIALAIRLDSQGPIFYRQTRVGRKGQPFAIVKFRSMVIDADARKAELQALNVAGNGLFKVKDDPRVTRVGRFLRSSSLDELPQLLNVLRGDMSLVGPRPLVTDEDAQVLGLDRSRLRLKPGMTGPWQLLGARVDLQEMVEIDYLYASQWSLWLDVKLMLATMRYVMRRRNL
jgi:exopolysaccharide biosynthesis polyprenyl glycosylphosphotransferase